MIIALALAAAATGPADAAATQIRLDALLHKCSAEGIMRLTAQSGRQVIITMAQPERAPTASENRQVGCVLAGTQRMKDLQFGFLGNERDGR